MNVDFWHQKWEKIEIGFHQSKPNLLLVANFNKLKLAEGSRVFLPLCGKTLDIGWLLSNGYHVVGAELSGLAIEQLFDELGLVPDITECGELILYRADKVDIFVGDIFDLSSELIGAVDAIYDRAALVALPEDMRKRYAKHLLEITDSAEQLLITFEYDQSLINGPPFSINSEEVNQHYNAAYNLLLIESKSVEGGLKGVCAATEHIWLLTN
ncbi:thiopurine S-methyltransferase [Methylophaga sp. 42_25_T18]|nr:thiopurine S-methyltransferase [Methylophaga sp. 42_25_T18]